MTIKARLDRANVILRVKGIRKARASMNYASSGALLKQIDERVRQKDEEIRTLMVHHREAMSSSATLNPVLMSTSTQYLEAQQQQREVLMRVLQQRRSDLDTKRQALTNCNISEHLFEELADKLKRKHWAQIIKQEIADR